MSFRCCKTLLAFMAFLVVLSPGTGLALSHEDAFPDVAPTHPEYDAIELLQRMNVIGGFEDGTFRPDLPVTRAGVVQMALLASGQLPAILTPGKPMSYPDVDAKAPSAGFIERAVEKGYLTPDGKAPFRPNDPATRAEALKLALSIFGITPAIPTKAPYSDVDVKAWEAPYAAYAKEHALLRTTGSGLLPGTPMRRAELAQMIATLLHERLDADRPALPLPVAIPLAIGWVLCAIPLMRGFWVGRGPLWQKLISVLAALILGAVGALVVVLLRLTALRVRDEETNEVPGRRRSFTRRPSAKRFFRWCHAAEPQLLVLALLVGYLVLVVHAVRITNTTALLARAYG